LAIYADNRETIAVVLTDMMMPIMDGQALIHALTQLNPAIKIVASSGVSLSEDQTGGTGFGIGYFLLKPYTTAALLNALRLVLEQA
ncbi:MAG TPA: response regulator, partial [Steroidobacteraceae bacterium]